MKGRDVVSEDNRFQHCLRVVEFMAQRRMPFRIQYVGNECVFHVAEPKTDGRVQEAIDYCRTLPGASGVWTCSIWPSSRFVPSLTGWDKGGF